MGWARAVGTGRGEEIKRIIGKFGGSILQDSGVVESDGWSLAHFFLERKDIRFNRRSSMVVRL